MMSQHFVLGLSLTQFGSRQHSVTFSLIKGCVSTVILFVLLLANIKKNILKGLVFLSVVFKI